MSSPSTRTVPALGSSRPSSIDRVVVLPAPLPPSSAAVTPRSTAKPMPSTATVRAVALDEIVDEDDGFGHRPYMAHQIAAQLRQCSRHRPRSQSERRARRLSGDAGRKDRREHRRADRRSREPRAAFDRISLRRLVLIRWVAIAGQAADAADRALRPRLPTCRSLPALAVVGCSVLLNLVVTLSTAAPRPGSASARPRSISATTCCSSALLLYLTGGLQNPFAILILAPVTVAATILSRAR